MGSITEAFLHRAPVAVQDSGIGTLAAAKGLLTRQLRYTAYAYSRIHVCIQGSSDFLAALAPVVQSVSQHACSLGVNLSALFSPSTAFTKVCCGHAWGQFWGDLKQPEPWPACNVSCRKRLAETRAACVPCCLSDPCASIQCTALSLCSGHLVLSNWLCWLQVLDKAIAASLKVQQATLELLATPRVQLHRLVAINPPASSCASNP